MSEPTSRRQLESRLERLSHIYWSVWTDGCGDPDWLARLTFELRDLVTPSDTLLASLHSDSSLLRK